MHPAIGAGLVGGGVVDAEAGLIFEVVGEEWGFDAGAEFVADGFAEVERPEMALGGYPATVTPGAENHVDAMRGVGGLVVGFERGVFSLRTPEIFLIPPAADFQGGHSDGGEVVLHGAASPEVVVGRVGEEGLAGGQIIDGAFAGGGEGAGVEEEGVGVFLHGGEGVLFTGLHAEDVVVAIGLAESAVVEEVVAEPDVGHGGLRRNGANGRMRIDAGFGSQEPRIRNADDADAAVVVADVREEPGDGVVGVGALVDGMRVMMVGEGTHHDEGAFGFVTAADVFHHEDVAALGQARCIRPLMESEEESSTP